jgi:hypothetical protein
MASEVPVAVRSAIRVIRPTGTGCLDSLVQVDATSSGTNNTYAEPWLGMYLIVDSSQNSQYMQPVQVRHPLWIQPLQG